jgi:hypothetical protein
LFHRELVLKENKLILKANILMAEIFLFIKHVCRGFNLMLDKKIKLNMKINIFRRVIKNFLIKSKILKKLNKLTFKIFNLKKTKPSFVIFASAKITKKMPHALTVESLMLKF